MKSILPVKTMLSAIFAALLLISHASFFTTHAQTATGQSQQLSKFLQHHLYPKGPSKNSTTRYTAAAIHQFNYVYLSGPDWCGSGGCTLLILESSGNSFKMLGRVTIAQLPICVLPTSTNGKPDVGVGVAGGGIIDGYEAVLRFNGHRYPGNPSVPPAQKLRKTEGAVIIRTIEQSVPLFN